MKDELIYSKLAKAVLYIIETGVWKTQFFWSYSEVIWTITNKLNVSNKLVMNYINKAMRKLIGPEYSKTQFALREKLMMTDNFVDLLYKPTKTKGYISRERKKTGHYDSTYNKAFREHYHMTRGDMNRKHYAIIHEHYDKTNEWLDYEQVKKDFPINGYKRK